jgi:hypothetical protein
MVMGMLCHARPANAPPGIHTSKSGTAWSSGHRDRAAVTSTSNGLSMSLRLLQGIGIGIGIGQTTRLVRGGPWDTMYTMHTRA